MKAFRLGKSRKNSKGQLGKDKSITSTSSNASLRSNLKHDKVQSYTSTLYNSMNRSFTSSTNTTNSPIRSNSYTNYLANSNNNNNNNNTMSHREGSPKSLTRNVSLGKVPEFRVGVRLRPMLETEKDDSENEELVYLLPQNNILCIREPGTDRLPEIDDGPPPPPGTIAPSMGPYIGTDPFNYVFGAKNNQEDVYMQSVHPLVEHFHKGKNSLVLAYGQMGSGKTYTIGFQPEDYNLENFQPDKIGKELGFVPRAFQETLSYMHHLKSQGRSVNLLVTFIAISCEDIADLLGESITRYKRPPSPGPKMHSPNDKRETTPQPKTITVHDRGKQGTYLKGAKYERIESMERLAELLYRGTTFRRIVFGPDSENLSHAILSFHLEQENPKNNKDKIYSKLNFVDLSCTEKIDKVEARMNRMETGVNDKSWLALSKVINLLTGRPKGYIPYRDSKLTQFLQDSLSGDAIVFFLSCLAPTACDESKSVLKYMIRSTNIDQRQTVVPPKILKSILYNLENMMNDTPTSPVNALNHSSNNNTISPNQSIISHNSNTSNKQKYDSPALANISTTVNLTSPNVNEDLASPGQGDSTYPRISNSNQSLDSSFSSMSRLAANTSLLFTDADASNTMSPIYEEENNRVSQTYSNISSASKGTLERPPRRPISKRTSSLAVVNKEGNLINRTNQPSLHTVQSVPSINSLRNSLIMERKSSDRKSSTAGMTQMLEEQLKALDDMEKMNNEDISNLNKSKEIKGHHKKNSDGKKRISFHKHLLSFHKAVCTEVNKQVKDKEIEPIANQVPIPIPKSNENINDSLAVMLNEIRNTIGEKARANDDVNINSNINSANNVDKLVYYLKILLQNYSKNEEQVSKLTALINNSNIINNNNYHSNPLSAVVSNVENLKYEESSGSTPRSSIEIVNVANTTPPPNHPPPPVPIESPIIKPPSYNKNNNSNQMRINTSELGSDDINTSPINRNINSKEHNLSALVSKGKSVLKNSFVYKNSPTASPNTYSEDMVMEDMDQAELNKYITNLSIRLKNSINEVKEERDKCDLLRQKEKNLERKLRIRDKELEALHIELDERINSFNNAVKVLVMQLGMAQESKSKTQEELSSVEYRTMELAKSLETISELMNGDRKNNRNAEDKYHNFVAEYEEEINILQSEKSQIIHEKESLKQQNANLQSKINKLVKTLKKFQVNLIESEKRNYYDATANMTNLKNENNLLKRKVEELNQTKAFLESSYHDLQVEYEKVSQAANSSSYEMDEDNSDQIEEYKKEIERLKTKLREEEEDHQAEVYKLLDRVVIAESKQGSTNSNVNNYTKELEKKLEISYAAQKELKEKLKATEAAINKKSLENKELEGRCLSFKKSISTLQDTVNTYENHQIKLLNTNYNLSSQLNNNGKKGKTLNTRSYSGFRTIMQDIKKMTVTELQDEVVELRQEVESINKKNWDLKLEVDRYQSANESNRRTIMLLMKRINGEKGNTSKKDDGNTSPIVGVDESRSSSFSKDQANLRNSNSSLNSKHESNTTLLNSETFDEDYSKSSSKLPVLSEVNNETLLKGERIDDEDTTNVSPYLINKSNSSSSSTAVNLPIHAMPNHEGFIAKDSEARSLSQESSSSDFSMIKVNDEVCIRESSLSTESMKYSQDINYNDY
ncbi:hypothetical protein BCR36DRAFT_335841 [Piromyces finnis]|uniref:Kinesin motor domain-containing protein n=1 Tax=Piromyces finnis TaxID=1754191 RepID=A0A1Y1UZ15_9FUNG|nr:hypothetical protein BCR36DRAFT_335841 [Piromyces finnis]|eukprot:ORX43664.1 hypothetical protein BCR36DRAFT_335841 [Piromyces finnis]